MLTKGMAIDWGPYGINVNGLGPGYFKTDLTEKLVADPAFTSWLVGRTPSRRWGDVQELGRLLSTRHEMVSLAARGRLVVPEGFREFLAVEPSADLVVVGAAVCVEIWQPAAWAAFVTGEMPGFRRRMDELTA
jgi:NAD(P)-dependent dehydrogenase (short-subunit alcohol dehydrogenase family)